MLRNVDAERISDRTTIGMFARQAAGLEQRTYVRHHDGGDWRAVSWSQMREWAQRVAVHLLDAGVEPGDRSAILAENRLEWLVCDLAIQMVGGVTVPIYPTVPTRTVQHILDHSGSRMVFVANDEDRARLAPHRAIRMDTEVSEWMAEDQAAEALAWVQARAEAVRPDDLCTIVYTSGTTGEPKGVMLAHRCIADIVRSSLEAFPVGPEDEALSFLPYAHVFERINGIFESFASGATGWLSRGIDRLADDMRECRPTVMVSVPRVYEKMHQRVMAQVAVSPGHRRLLFRWAVGQGRRHSRGQWAPLHAIADRLVLAKLRYLLCGGRLRFFVSGGAPLSREVEEFFWSIGVKILNGWGMTETSSGACSNTLAAHRFETVGRPLPGVEMSVAEDGELLVRSPGNMLGYFRNEAATAETFVDGWLRTGDVGEIDPDGFIRITDRKKDLIKTASGKFVAPQVHESRLQQAAVIERAVVLGDERPYVVALIVPEWHALKLETGIDGDPERLVEDERVRARIQRHVDELNQDLGSWETIKYFELLPHDFSEEGGEVTPTLKIKRRVIETHHRDKIEAMYAHKKPPAEATHR
jgi:long-chain acyl-CoA synthetase